jgi:hypothetical protein
MNGPSIPTIKFSFKVDLEEPTQPELIQGSTLVPHVGPVAEITMDFYRCGVRAWNIQATSIKFAREKDQTRLAFLAWDRSVDRTGKGNYRVEGEIIFYEG